MGEDTRHCCLFGLLAVQAQTSSGRQSSLNKVDRRPESIVNTLTWAPKLDIDRGFNRRFPNGHFCKPLCGAEASRGFALSQYSRGLEVESFPDELYRLSKRS